MSNPRFGEWVGVVEGESVVGVGMGWFVGMKGWRLICVMMAMGF